MEVSTLMGAGLDDIGIASGYTILYFMCFPKEFNPAVTCILIASEKKVSVVSHIKNEYYLLGFLHSMTSWSSKM